MQGAQAPTASAEQPRAAEAPAASPEANGRGETGWKLTREGDAAILEGSTCC